MSEETLLLIDGHGLAYRAFFALPELSAPDGTPTGAVVGFANMLFKILEQWKPSGGALVFDAPGPTFRHEAYEGYKEGRSPMPDLLRAQIPLLHELGELLGISVVARQGVEADDVLGATAL
ncbi:MAG TPA: DNA polymerase I, partial [Synergistaceae bacterium]|nr:DNA polymerase I [Synergistaceae bacterium]